MKNLVIFDVDGVVADFEGKLVSVLTKEFGDIGHANRDKFSLEERFKNRPDVLKRAKELVENPNFYYGLDVYEGAENFSKELAEARVDVMYVSSRPASSENFTRRWLIKNLYGQMGDVYCGIADKVSFLEPVKDSVDFIVEDSPNNIEKLKKAGFQVLCWEQPWNQGVFPRLYVRADGEVMLWADESIEAEPFFMAEEIEK